MSPVRRRRTPPLDAPLPIKGLAHVDLSVDLHGMRVQEAIPALERHLRLCHSAGIHVAHVVHGRGSGALRDAVREALDRHPLVARHYAAAYGQGGDGVTIVELDRGRPPVRRRSHDAAPAPTPARRRTRKTAFRQAPSR